MIRSKPIRSKLLTLGGVALLFAAAAPVWAQGSASPAESSRFLAQATFGGNWEEIQRVSEMGFDAWIDEQFQQPIGYHQPTLEAEAAMGIELDNERRRWVWWQRVMQSPDALRQRVAFALSEILVVSDQAGSIRENPLGLANYYDMLLEHSFGNYRDLLMDVTLHPIMGVYLSHLRNVRSNPAAGRFPDENYAREIMQLFSIGLFELRPDGTEVLDGAGRPISTYTNDDITEFAKVFTGLSYRSPSVDFWNGSEYWTEPMRMYDQYHEPGPKFLLRGTYLPAGRTGMQDVEDAVDNLFEHPNVGPFIARRLIQRLVTSNPSPAYIERVATAFNNNGAGVRGDMKAVVRALLMDPEARDLPNITQVEYGKMRESFLRRVHLARAFDAANFTSTYPISDFGASDNFGQRPLSSPSVFNFFLPDFQPTGPIAAAELVAPEFQILTTVTAISSANALRSQVDGVMNSADNPIDEVRLDLADELAIASNPVGLVDRLDLLMMNGSMSGPMRQILIQALQQIPDLEDRTKVAIYLITISPEYAILK